MSDNYPDTLEPKLDTPEAWGKALDCWSVRNGDWATAYQVADSLYGWSMNKYHFANDPFVLSQEDFELGLLVSGQYPLEQPHEAALSPYAIIQRDKKTR